MLFLLMMPFILSVFSQTVEGDWNGKLKIGNVEMKLVFHVYNDNGVLSGKMDSPDQMAYGISLDKITQQDADLHIEIKNAGIAYDARLVNDTTLDGRFRQGPADLPLMLHRERIKSLEIKRSQEPQPPLPYHNHEITFMNTADNILLAGTMTIPVGSGPFPALVLVSGSGPQDRNEEISNHKPFLVLSDFLTKNGYIVLRYDDRGTAMSKGVFQGSNTFDFARDAEAALAFLRKQEKVRSGKVGLIGHSEGGLIAGILGGQNNSPDFEVMLAAPLMNGGDVLLWQKFAIDRKMGASEEVLELNKKIMTQIYQLIKVSADPVSVRDTLMNYLKTNFSTSLSETQIKGMTAQLTDPWFYTFIKLNPMDYFPKVKIPVLALFGGKDLQVDAVENSRILQDLKHKDSMNNVEVKVLEGLNHLFQECDTGLLDEYAKLDQTLSPGMLEALLVWLNKTTRNN